MAGTSMLVAPIAGLAVGGGITAALHVDTTRDLATAVERQQANRARYGDLEPWQKHSLPKTERRDVLGPLVSNTRGDRIGSALAPGLSLGLSGVFLALAAEAPTMHHDGHPRLAAFLAAAGVGALLAGSGMAAYEWRRD